MASSSTCAAPFEVAGRVFAVGVALMATVLYVASSSLSSQLNQLGMWDRHWRSRSQQCIGRSIFSRVLRSYKLFVQERDRRDEGSSHGSITSTWTLSEYPDTIQFSELCLLLYGCLPILQLVSSLPRLAFSRPKLFARRQSVMKALLRTPSFWQPFSRRLSCTFPFGWL